MGSACPFSYTAYRGDHWPVWATHMPLIELMVTIFCNSVLVPCGSLDGFSAVHAAISS